MLILTLQVGSAGVDLMYENIYNQNIALYSPINTHLPLLQFLSITLAQFSQQECRSYYS